MVPPLIVAGLPTLVRRMVALGALLKVPVRPLWPARWVLNVAVLGPRFGDRVPAGGRPLPRAENAEVVTVITGTLCLAARGRTLPAAEADRMRAALLAAVSHDLRTPLASAKAAVTSLRSADVQWDPEDTEELLAAADESLDKLTRLVENLLDMSRLQAARSQCSPGRQIWPRSWHGRWTISVRRGTKTPGGGLTMALSLPAAPSPAMHFLGEPAQDCQTSDHARQADR